MPDINSLINQLHEAAKRTKYLQAEINTITGQNELDAARNEAGEIIRLRARLAEFESVVSEYRAKEVHHAAAVALAAERGEQLERARAWARLWKRAAKLERRTWREALGLIVERRL